MSQCALENHTDVATSNAVPEADDMQDLQVRGRVKVEARSGETLGHPDEF